MLTTLERRKIAAVSCCGQIAAESDSLILLHKESCFQFDGYAVLRRRDITKSSSSDANAYCERLMRKERLWKNPPKAIRSLPLASWETLFTALFYKVVILENERQGDLFIGPVILCDDRSVWIHHFDGCGRWETVERILYRSITRVQFADRYSTIHAKHLPPRPLGMDPLIIDPLVIRNPRSSKRRRSRLPSS